MAPLRPSDTAGRPRRPNLPRRVQVTQTPQLPSPPPVAAPPPPPAAVMTPAAQSTPTYSTWLPMPPFMSSSSIPTVQASDLSASIFSVQDESEIGSYPPGGFLSFMQRSSNCSLQENSNLPMTGNFVHASSHAQYAPFKVQPSEMAKAKSCHSLPEQNTPHSALGSQHAPIVDIDNTDANGGSPSMFTKKDTRASRAGKRMIWTPNETMRLVSAWLKNSNDTIKGNWKRNDQYWGSVTAMFNSTTPADRTREIKQLKEQWHRVNRIVHHFQGCFMKAERVRGSGESDEQVMDNAKAFFLGESDEGEFKLEACWKVLRDQPKWHAYNEDLNGSHKRKHSETETIDLTASANVGTDLPRPIGCKKAKEELNRKAKSKISSSIMDEIDKLREGQEKAKEDRIEILERHQQIATEKKESARLTHLAAQENKEAKLLEKEGKMHDKESKLLETYKALLMTDTSQMHEDMRAEHMLALKGMREMIFGRRASGQ